MNEPLKYPVGCYVQWMDINALVLENTDDIAAFVVTTSGAKGSFRFNYEGAKSEKITCPRRIMELDKTFFELRHNNPHLFE